MIALINYGSGNLRSVSKALEQVGADVRIVDRAEAMADAAAVVLPGVGAFGDCAANLRERKLWDPVAEWLAADRPFLGICLGYQLLFESSEEAPDIRGFGCFPGRVVRFPARPGLKVPHMGWNALEPARPGYPLWQGLPPAPHVFFVHSYYPAPADEALITARCDYGGPFAAAASRGNLHAMQFHPEKSQDTGLAILRNFVATLA